VNSFLFTLCFSVKLNKLQYVLVRVMNLLYVRGFCAEESEENANDNDRKQQGQFQEIDDGAGFADGQGTR
jgi:hypothetical protein